MHVSAGGGRTRAFTHLAASRERETRDPRRLYESTRRARSRRDRNVDNRGRAEDPVKFPDGSTGDTRYLNVRRSRIDESSDGKSAIRDETKREPLCTVRVHTYISIHAA